MKLVETLAAGIAVAATGTVILNRRGTSTRASYYKDFEASQLYTAQPIALDSSGSAVIYVSQLVDVLVYDADGVLVREFVAGDDDASVEVISPSFTGTSYSDGSSGASKPTTLENVLDLWVGSAGTTDFKVIPSGGSTALTLSAATAALAGLFFNVKTYGAVGNGVADDTAAINAATAAAAATSTAGGTVVFPSGTYRATTTITWPPGVKMLGSGGSSSKLMFDYGAGQNLQISPTDALTVFEGMYISAQTTNTAFSLVRIAAAGRINIFDCTIGGDSQAQGACVQFVSVGASATIARCKLRMIGNVGCVTMSQNLVRVTDCELLNVGTVGGTHIVAASGLIVTGCRFSCDSVTSGTTRYIDFGTSGTYGAPIIVGNYFADGVAVTPTCIFNSLATPDPDVHESDNTFGLGSTVGFTLVRYGYTLDGYAPITSRYHYGWHGSRYAAQEIKPNVTDADAKSFGTTVYIQAANFPFNATLGSLGDKWTLMVINTSGGAITVTPNAAQVVLDAGAVSFNVAAGGRSMRTFEWLPIVAGTTPGRWTQIAPGLNI